MTSMLSRMFRPSSSHEDNSGTRTAEHAEPKGESKRENRKKEKPNKELTVELDISRGNAKELTAELDALREKMVFMEGRSSCLVKSLREADANLAASKVDNTEKEKRNKELTLELDTLRGNAKDLRLEVDALRDSMVELKKQDKMDKEQLTSELIKDLRADADVLRQDNVLESLAHTSVQSPFPGSHALSEPDRPDIRTERMSNLTATHVFNESLCCSGARSRRATD